MSGLQPLLDHIAHGVQVAETEKHIKGTPTFIIRKGGTVVAQSDQVLTDGYPALAALLAKAAP